MKYYIIPAEIVQSWRSQIEQKRADSPEEHNEELIRSDMQKLSRNDYQKYSQKLGEYLTARNKQDYRSNTEETIDKIQMALPSNMRNASALLLNKLLSTDEISIDEEDRIVLGDKVIQSNVVDVVRYLVGKSRDPPSGSQEVIDLMSRNNYPESLIRNPAARFSKVSNVSVETHVCKSVFEVIKHIVRFCGLPL